MDMANSWFLLRQSSPLGTKLATLLCLPAGIGSIFANVPVVTSLLCLPTGEEAEEASGSRLPSARGIGAGDGVAGATAAAVQDSARTARFYTPREMPTPRATSGQASTLAQGICSSRPLCMTLNEGACLPRLTHVCHAQATPRHGQSPALNARQLLHGQGRACKGALRRPALRTHSRSCQGGRLPEQACHAEKTISCPPCICW